MPGGQPQTTLDPAAGAKTRLAPMWHVILIDDDDHTYDYVIQMICELFRYDRKTAYEMARTVDTAGRVVLDTTTLERAELKRDQIHAYGKDPRIVHCAGSMSAVIEPAA